MDAFFVWISVRDEERTVHRESKSSVFAAFRPCDTCQCKAWRTPRESRTRRGARILCRALIAAIWGTESRNKSARKGEFERSGVTESTEVSRSAVLAEGSAEAGSTSDNLFSDPNPLSRLQLELGHHLLSSLACSLVHLSVASK